MSNSTRCPDCGQSLYWFDHDTHVCDALWRVWETESACTLDEFKVNSTQIRAKTADDAANQYAIDLANEGGYSESVSIIVAPLDSDNATKFEVAIYTMWHSNTNSSEPVVLVDEAQAEAARS